MKKIINPCHTPDGNVFCEINFNDARLSITGVVGPMPNGNARGACGQINMSFAESYPEETRTYSEGWTPELFAAFLAVWDKWHLNDMRAGCPHQRELWNTAKELTVTRYTWGPSFHAARRAVEDATATPEEYQHYQTMKTRVYMVTIGMDTPKYETPEIGELLAGGWAKVEKTETKTAGWVSPLKHPEGLLSKPCPVCRYAYGSAWGKETVPDEVLTFLESLPETTKTPAWV